MDSSREREYTFKRHVCSILRSYARLQLCFSGPYEPTSLSRPLLCSSMATPHVAGVAALVWNHFHQCSANQIRNALLKTAQDKGESGCDDKYGFGIVKARAAYDLLAQGGCDAGGPPVAEVKGGCGRNLPCEVKSDCPTKTCKFWEEILGITLFIYTKIHPSQVCGSFYFFVFRFSFSMYA